MSDWITHEGTDPPALAPAALVEIALPTRQDVMRRKDFLGWFTGLRYRILRDPEGVPYVSAEGLEDWAEWVATDNEVGAFQYQRRPTAYGEEDWLAHFLARVREAPETHLHPGDWRESLYRVWRP